ncbi:hypothetical protein RB195_022770 [Necator americanus]|uniref:Uncharacterized protein n=1 Tax=Necator americanus TaxID=51031 RepID=A0ABR1EGG9_NECAM
MTSTMATPQGLLTRSGNRLSAIIQEKSETINAYVHSSMEAAEISALRKRICTAKTAIGTEANKLEATMKKFSEAVDRLDDKTQSLPDIIGRIKTNTTAAQTLLDKANKVLARLIQEKLEFNQEKSSLNRNIDNLFNYLLDALEGDAEESVKHFEVSGSIYQLVIEHLKEKYGDKQALIDQLLKNLHGARARTDSLEEQEALCEQLHSITSQLTLKGGTRRQCFPAKGAACEVLSGCSEAYLAAENAVEERRKLEYGSFALSSKGAYQDRA